MWKRQRSKALMPGTPVSIGGILLVISFYKNSFGLVHDFAALAIF